MDIKRHIDFNNDESKQQARKKKILHSHKIENKQAIIIYTEESIFFSVLQFFHCGSQ